MRQGAGRSTLVALVLAVSLAGTNFLVGDTTTVTAKEIMGKLNKGPQSLMPTVGKALRAAAPDWDGLQARTKDFLALTEALEKVEPPAGNKDSWAKLTKAYHDDAQAMKEAAGQKDKESTLAAHQKLRKSCKGCHEAHRKKA